MRPALKLASLLDPSLKSKLAEIETQFSDLEKMVAERERFAKRFGPMGWTNYDRLSVDLVHSVVSLPDDVAAEQALTAFHLDPQELEFLGYRFHTKAFEPWRELYERAVERAAGEDYLSAVPLILIIIDGICTTKTGKHPFSGGADAPVFDSETSGPGGISEGLAILGATRRKLDVSPIDSPYRHGIVHGLNPTFGSPIVAAKAFNLLQASIDYFDHRADEEARIAKAQKEQEPPDWSDLSQSMRKTEEIKQQCEAWRARPVIHKERLASSDEPSALDPGTPEAAAANYLSAIAAMNFGVIAKTTIDHPKRPLGYLAGRHRESLGDLRITRWEIIGVTDSSPAISDVVTQLEGTYGERSWTGEQEMRLIYTDDDFRGLPRGNAEGRWSVMPNFVPNLWSLALRSMGAQPDVEHDN